MVVRRRDLDNVHAELIPCQSYCHCQCRPPLPRSQSAFPPDRAGWSAARACSIHPSRRCRCRVHAPGRGRQCRCSGWAAGVSRRGNPGQARHSLHRPVTHPLADLADNTRGTQHVNLQGHCQRWTCSRSFHSDTHISRENALEANASVVCQLVGVVVAAPKAGVNRAVGCNLPRVQALSGRASPGARASSRTKPSCAAFQKKEPWWRRLCSDSKPGLGLTSQVSGGEEEVRATRQHGRRRTQMGVKVLSRGGVSQPALPTNILFHSPALSRARGASGERGGWGARCCGPHPGQSHGHPACASAASHTPPPSDPGRWLGHRH